ncbi:MAG: FtsX-like permease family protein [Ruminococcus sp.]|uniref:ABC transporter permease n=1 Tax=Ruminococcus sp. TaxID=41978 RepID=UPI0025EDA067|nr:FtsX-like permease family protein [Ruminococcus sp.]MCR5601043.1 FtsX-like permease family protein [Ruminococcus sp.]
MYLRILKKDLKRKKTMNTILLLFVILATMFAASSVNNIITVMGGLDNYFRKANMSDHFIISTNGNSDEISKQLSEKPNIKEFRREDQLFFNDTALTQNGKKVAELGNNLMLLSIDNAQLNYFDENNEIIKDVPEGKAYFTGALVVNTDIGIGDEFQLKIGDTVLTLQYAGIGKDAFLGSVMMNNPRLIVSDADYEKFLSDAKARENNSGSIFYINGYDKKTLESDLSDIQGTLFNKGINIIKTSYLMNTLIAGILLIVSICLILVSFVVLSFTISFTVNEEFREIGVMKALGLKNSSVRALYLVKYLGISLIGAVIGYALSVPFGNMLLDSVSDNIVLESDNSVIIGILCSITAVLIIILFCWHCTAKIKKLSPIDAVRSGQTGERFKKKGILDLGRSKLCTTGFMAFNDVLSSPKQFGIMTSVFTVCLLLIMCLANSANTLASEKLLALMCSIKSDAYMTDSDMRSQIMSGGMGYSEMCSYIEDTLAENGMPCKVHAEALLYPTIETSKGKKASPIFNYDRETKASEYTYSEGYAPKYKNEIALTYTIADKLEVGIGDKVNLTINGKTDEYIISALFQSMMQLGESGRFHESMDIPDELIAQTMGFQIDFDDSPDKDEAERRIEKIKDIFGTEFVFDADGFVMQCIGSDVSDMIDSVKLLVLLITVAIIIMISVLMERSFISKEKSEIALMKAMGFRSGSIIAQHTLRFFIVSVIASALSIALCLPFTKLCIDPIFGIMGAVSGVEYNFRFAEVCVLYPIIVISATILGAFLTAQYMKTVKASDTADID